MEGSLFTYRDPAPPPSPDGGPLRGKSLVVQPCLAVRGWPTEAGSRALKRFVALEDATAVRRLRAQGAVVTGSTRMSELGFGLAGDTTAAAFRQGACDAALMYDAMGECRVAAAEAGAFGFKPSWGIVSRFGLIGLAPSLECIGVLAATPEDIALIVASLAGDDENDFSMPAGEMPEFLGSGGRADDIRTAGVPREMLQGLTAEETASFRAVLDKLGHAGIAVRDVDLPEYPLFETAHRIIGAVEASSSCGKYDGVRYGHRASAGRTWNDMYLRTRGESFSTLVKSYLFQGAYFQFENYGAFVQACRLRRRLVKRMERLLGEVDVLVGPTRKAGERPAAPDTVPAAYLPFAFTLPANVTGLPAVHIPHVGTEKGTDPGLQCIGPRLADARLIALAARLSPFREGGKNHGS